MDLAIAGPAIVLLAPVMVAVALAVRIDSPGPVFYGSVRLGHSRPRFQAWKFRSMHTEADSRLKAVLDADPTAAAEYRRFHKLKYDPRLTRVGRFIRRTSLDELPQLFNILRGEMSVVGPRPKLPSEADLFGSSLPEVLRVRPGLTGLWQVSGRNNVPVEERVGLDIRYVRTRTLGGDLLICARTVRQLAKPGNHGAY